MTSLAVGAVVIASTRSATAGAQDNSDHTSESARDRARRTGHGIEGDRPDGRLVQKSDRGSQIVSSVDLDKAQHADRD
jgi:hypothetical protein